jgi:hypothetical protein
MRTGFVRLLVAVLPLVAVIPQPTQAQVRAPRGGQELSREQMQRRILMGFEERIVRELGIDEVQGERLRSVTREFRDARRDLMRERIELGRDVRRFVEDEGTDARARRLLDRMRQMRAREAELQRREEERLLEILTPGQLLRLQILREEFADRIRRLESGERGPRGREPDPRRRDPPGTRHLP